MANGLCRWFYCCLQFAGKNAFLFRKNNIFCKQQAILVHEVLDKQFAAKFVQNAIKAG